GHAGRGRPRDARPDLRRLVRPDLHELPVDDAPLLRVEAQHGHLRGALERADAQLVLHGAGRAAADVPHAAAEPDRTGAGVHVARDLVRHARRVERLVAHARGVDEQEVDAVAVLLRRARDLREPGRVLLGRLLARGLAPEAEPRLERVAVTQDPDALDLDDLPVQDGLAVGALLRGGLDAVVVAVGHDHRHALGHRGRERVDAERLDGGAVHRRVARVEDDGRARALDGRPDERGHAGVAVQVAHHEERDEVLLGRGLRRRLLVVARAVAARSAVRVAGVLPAGRAVVGRVTRRVGAGRALVGGLVARRTLTAGGAGVVRAGGGRLVAAGRRTVAGRRVGRVVGRGDGVEPRTREALDVLPALPRRLEVGVRARVEVLVLAVEVDEHRAVRVDDAREPARDAGTLERGPVEDDGRALGRAARRPGVARGEGRRDERHEDDARGDLVRARRDALAELAPA